MFTFIRILSFTGIIAAPLLYAVAGKLSDRTVWTDNVISLVVRWGIVFAASLFSPSVFRILRTYPFLSDPQVPVQSA